MKRLGVKPFNLKLDFFFFLVHLHEALWRLELSLACRWSRSPLSFSLLSTFTGAFSSNLQTNIHRMFWTEAAECSQGYASKLSPIRNLFLPPLVLFPWLLWADLRLNCDMKWFFLTFYSPNLAISIVDSNPVATYWKRRDNLNGTKGIQAEI